MKKNRYSETHYTLIDELMASTVNPLPEAFRVHQLTSMWQGLRSMETHNDPKPDDWRVVSDAVNLMETLIKSGVAIDESGLLMDAITALAEAGRRSMEGKTLRLSGPGMFAVRSILEDYAECVNALPARTMIRCHRQTEKRMQEILSGKRQSHDVEIG